jgi:hypothetical protein
MARVSKKFAEQVKGYDVGGTQVRSLEGRGISSSRSSLDNGRKLAQKNLKRVRRLKARP